MPTLPTLLLTRPAARSAEFADAVTARLGAPAVAVIVSPLLDLRFVEADLPAVLPKSLIFTSQNGVAGLARLSADRNAMAYCVGERTAEAARAAGFRARSTAGGDAASLLADLLTRPEAAPFLHVRGRHARGDIAGGLNAAGIGTAEVIVYDQIAQPLSDEAKAVLAGPGPVLVPLFSPRTAALFADAAGPGFASLHVIAISAAAAEAVRGLTLGSLSVAARPDAAAMLATTIDRFAADGVT